MLASPATQGSAHATAASSPRSAQGNKRMMGTKAHGRVFCMNWARLSYHELADNATTMRWGHVERPCSPRTLAPGKCLEPRQGGQQQRLAVEVEVGRLVALADHAWP